jgi:phosphonopyruvate decarboxylase
VLDTKEYFEFIRSLGIEFFSGVPDSLLKSFCGYINDNVKDNHIISANEGNAIGMGIGYHIASGKIPLIYMQNSGLGNAINPIISLADKEIYSIPMLIMIGWRGEPGKKDEPQHLKQGRVMISMLEAMELEHFIISGNAEKDYESTRTAYNLALENSSPVALVVTKDAFSNYSYNKINNNKILFPVNSREEALKSIIKTIPSDSLVVSTTGMISREIFEARESLKQGHEKDFLTVGGMGHASSIAYTLSKYSNKSRMTFCIDGDGATIMHMGALSNIGNSRDKNFKHILINNGCHDSVGGQETVAFDIDFEKLVTALGYNFVKFNNQISLEENIQSLVYSSGPSFLEIKVPSGSRASLGRPTTSPVENKIAMEKFLRN